MRGFGFRLVFATSIVFALMVTATQVGYAQTFAILHTFTGGNDGGKPFAGVTSKAGDLYGTTYAGGDLACNPPHGCGTVYQLKHLGSSWRFNYLYIFTGIEGAIATAPVVFGPDGTLYSTTEYGGYRGNVFKLKPSPLCWLNEYNQHMRRCSWEYVLYSFAGGTDGSKPIGLVFDQADNIYGTTSSGGAYGGGTVYQLTWTGSAWKESIIHGFGAASDGNVPYRSVLVFDTAGNLYGTTYFGGSSNDGTVFQLTPSGSSWTEKVIYSFQGDSDGRYPYSGLIIDQSGNLYGTTTDAGTGGGGTVFELSPSGGGWTYSVLHSLKSSGTSCGPAWALVMDAGGNLYETTQCDGANGLGNVFKLTNTGGSWTYTSLHDFTGGNDGALPISGVILDPSGVLYGTTSAGGAKGQGVVWELTP